jgi:tetratricopeptide (TPR) repeat protein
MMDGVEDVTTAGQLAVLLRALRRRHARSQNDKELTVREIAAKSGYAVGRVSEYLSGVTLPPTDRFDVLIGILGATAKEHVAHVEHDCVEVFEALLAAAEREGDHVVQLQALTRLGAAHNHAQRFAKALDLLERARDRYAEVEDHAGRGAVMASLGLSYAGLGRHDEALAITCKALALHRSMDHRTAAPFLQEARDGHETS